MGANAGCGGSRGLASRFEDEAAQTPELAARQFRRLADELPDVIERLDRLSPALFATIARGSSDNAAAFAGYLFGMRLALPTASLPPSLASVYGRTLRLERALVLAVSQSGASPDLVAAAAHARAGGAWTLGLVNVTGSPLSREVQATIEIGAGRERAVAATKTFMLSATAVVHVLAAWTRDAALLAALEDLPGPLRDCAGVDWRAAVDLLAGKDAVFVIGRGPTLPVARELALKLKEVAGIHAEAASAAELLHGPISIASPSLPAIVFAGDDHTGASVNEAVGRLQAAGASVLVLATDASGSTEEWTVAIPQAKGRHPLLQPLVALHAAYRLVAEVARARGRDPDHPLHLVKVTRTL